MPVLSPIRVSQSQQTCDEPEVVEISETGEQFTTQMSLLSRKLENILDRRFHTLASELASQVGIPIPSTSTVVSTIAPTSTVVPVAGPSDRTEPMKIKTFDGSYDYHIYEVQLTMWLVIMAGLKTENVMNSLMH